MTDTQLIVTHFNIPEAIIQVAPLGEGFINDTFLVTTATTRYILQRKNKAIFPNVPGMMDNIHKVTSHIRAKAVAQGKDPKKATLQLVATHDGHWYFQDAQGDFWACCVFIEDSVCYSTADRLDLIYAGGVGIGQFQAQLADFEGTLVDTLPGFHNIRFRFEQFSQAVANNKAQRTSTLAAEIAQIFARQERMMAFFHLIETHVIPTRISHNDTKISNFLFDKDGNVMCAIDLDTVMQSTVLYDFGDAIRSYTNTCAEDEPCTEKISMDLARFEAYTKGYLSCAAQFLNEAELEFLAFSAKYITFEQYLRFLMDYIDGDTYYKIHYPQHNLVRAHAQLALLQSMESQYDAMLKVVKTIV